MTRSSEIKVLLTMTHLFPSRANFDGLLPDKDCGLVGFSGFFGADTINHCLTLDRPSSGGLIIPEAEPEVLGTTLPALSAGFLCVISLFSTFLKPLVTASPRLRSAKTFATFPAAFGPPDDGAGAGTGGGGGGAAACAAMSERYCVMGFP
jgi:hypothetical protein